MSKQVFPAIPGYNGQVYSDDKGAPEQLNLNHLAESFHIADLLKQLGHNDASECVRPVHMIAGFKPAALIQQLAEHAERGRACIACVNGNKMPELIWHPAPNGVNDLVRLKLAGGHVLGFICLNSDGSFTSNTLPTLSKQDQQLSTLLLNCFGRCLRDNPERVSVAELLTLNNPDNFAAQNAEKILDQYSEWCDQHPTNVHDEITYGNRTNEVSNVR